MILCDGLSLSLCGRFYQGLSNRALEILFVCEHHTCSRAAGQDVNAERHISHPSCAMSTEIEDPEQGACTRFSLPSGCLLPHWRSLSYTHSHTNSLILSLSLSLIFPFPFPRSSFSFPILSLSLSLCHCLCRIFSLSLKRRIGVRTRSVIASVNVWVGGRRTNQAMRHQSLTLSLPTGSAAEAAELVGELKQYAIVADSRGEFVRFGMGACHSVAHVDMLVAALEAIAAKRARKTLGHVTP